MALNRVTAFRGMSRLKPGTRLTAAEAIALSA